MQPEKTKLREEAEDALRWTALFERVDAEIGPDPSLLLLREVIAVMVPGSESGFLVRDLTPLQDGNFYLPALSLPWWGRQIASLHGADFETFWGACYAEAIGRAKAKLLTRYGLQYDTPNPQNLLIQLARDLRPTGVIALRDLGDVNPVAPLGGAGAAPWTRLHAELKPETQNSFWAFDSADEQRIPAETLARWYARHDLAYQAELRDFLRSDAARPRRRRPARRAATRPGRPSCAPTQGAARSRPPSSARRARGGCACPDPRAWRSPSPRRPSLRSLHDRAAGSIVENSSSIL